MQSLFIIDLCRSEHLGSDAFLGYNDSSVACSLVDPTFPVCSQPKENKTDPAQYPTNINTSLVIISP